MLIIGMPLMDETKTESRTIEWIDFHSVLLNCCVTMFLEMKPNSIKMRKKNINEQRSLKSTFKQSIDDVTVKKRIKFRSSLNYQ